MDRSSLAQKLLRSPYDDKLYNRVALENPRDDSENSLRPSTKAVRTSQPPERTVVLGDLLQG